MSPLAMTSRQRVLTALLHQEPDLGGIGTQGDPQGHKTFILVFLINLVEIGHFLPARAAEEREEIDQHHFTLELAQGVILALEDIFQGKVRSGLAGTPAGPRHRQNGDGQK